MSLRNNSELLRLIGSNQTLAGDKIFEPVPQPGAETCISTEHLS